MSDPVSALQGASFDGLVSITDRGPMGMITLRGDLASPAMAQALDRALNLTVPAMRQIVPAKGISQGQAAWMSPDELLLVMPYGQAGATLSSLQASLENTHFLAENVSDARAMFGLQGADASLRDVLAKLTPADLHPDSFGTGDFRRSRLEQVPAAFWMPETGRANIVCFRSVAAYVYDLLCLAAQPDARVDYFG